MVEDTVSRDEAGAREWAALLGRNGDFGSEVGDQEPNELLATKLGPDPWLPFTCPRCGDNDPHGMPQQCGCGFQNYGGTK